MRLAAVLMVGFLAAGCVAMADFTALRDELRNEVSLVKVDNGKLKETEEGLRKRLEEQERALKAAEIRQQAFEEQIRVLEAQSRRLEALTARREDTEVKPPAKIPSLEITPSGPSVTPPPPPAGPAVLTPTAAYNQAYNDYLQGNYDLAVAGFEAFLSQFPGTSLTAHAQYWIGEAYFNKKEYLKALNAYDRLLAVSPTSDKVAAALYKTGAAYAELEDKAKARVFLKRVIEEHPQSEEAHLAKQRLADLR